MKRLREWMESIVYAGMKPSGGPKQPVVAPETWLGRQRARIDKWISGGPAPTDPLYLTNRPLGQKIKMWSVVAVPLVILIAGVALVLSNVLTPETKPIAEMSPAEVAAKVLPNLKNLKIERNHNLDVQEVSIVQRGGPRMIGIVKNLTNRDISTAEISCDLTDSGGTQLGAVAVVIENIPASGTKTFDIPLKQTQSAFALVREISTK